MGEMRNAYNILVGKLERKRPLGRSRHRWEDDIRMDVREIWWEGVDWMLLTQNRGQCFSMQLVSYIKKNTNKRNHVQKYVHYTVLQNVD
jgi:fatty-acid desaturase